MSKHGKKYVEARKLVDRTKLYSPLEAIQLMKKAAYAKFDETVDLHMRLGIDPRHADQQVRGTVLLPHGTGKRVRILVFAEGEAETIARDGGADYAGTDELIQRIQEGWMEFDAVVAVPQVMGKVGRLGRVLGPRGLMPNPKAGTIVQAQDLPRVLKELRQGRIEFRVDRTANLHLQVGKVSFNDDQLLGNLTTVIDAVMRARPASLRGQYVRRITLTSTMGPGFRIDPLAAQSLEVL